jgi:hypothetical protein
MRGTAQQPWTLERTAPCGAQAEAVGEVVELEVGEGLESTNDLHGTVVGRRGNGGHGQKEANSA